ANHSQSTSPDPPECFTDFHSVFSAISGPPHRAYRARQPPRNMNKQLYLVLNGKGGVGKSFFAVNLVQFLKDRGVSHLAIDTDNENSTLKRFHPDSLYIRIDRE